MTYENASHPGLPGFRVLRRRVRRQESRRRSPQRRLDHQQVRHPRQGRVLADRAPSRRTIQPPVRLARNVRFRAWTSRSPAARTCTSPSRATPARSTAKASSTTARVPASSTSSRTRTMPREMSAIGFPMDDEKAIQHGRHGRNPRLREADEERASQRPRHRQADRVPHLRRELGIHSGPARRRPEDFRQPTN